jgi:hypothetical protein
MGQGTGIAGTARAQQLGICRVNGVPDLLRTILRDRFTWFFFALTGCIFAWDQHGRIGWLSGFLPGWDGIGHGRAVAPDGDLLALAWGQELAGFVGGAVLMVAVPALLAKWWLNIGPAEFGLGLPGRNRRGMALVHFTVLAALSIPGFWMAAYVPEIREFYPYYRGVPGTADFAFYELSAGLFYLAIEGMFRGFLLFGIIYWLGRVFAVNSPVDDLRIAAAAIVLAIIPYALWHLGKAPAEVWGTLFWGLGAGVSAVTIRTIWHLVLLHWLLNVFLDHMILLNP